MLSSRDHVSALVEEATRCRTAHLYLYATWRINMSATVNTFPPFQSMNSPRGWALAIIVLLHVALFSALMSGMGTRVMLVLKQPPTTMVDVPPIERVERVSPPTNVQVDQEPSQHIVVPEPDRVIDYSDEPAELVGTVGSRVPAQTTAGTEKSDPVLELPAIDPRLPLTEPEYPAPEIRLNHTGTVLLGVLVLENGRVGEVRIEQSSGFQRLDLAAQRAARRWRLLPGTQDGRAVAMWKTVPITFQLQK
jgi:protein TonB